MRYGNLLIEGKVTTRGSTSADADSLLFELGSSTANGFDGGSIVFKPGVGGTGGIAGSVDIHGAAALKFFDADNTNHVGFKAASTLAGDLVWTLPVADGAADTFLRTDGLGQLSWASFPNTFLTISDGTNTASADVANDSIVFSGSAGINVVVSDDPETVTFSITRTGLSDKAAPLAADQFLMFDSANSNAPVYVSVTNLLNTLDLVSGVVGTGMVVKTADDTYVARTIEVASTAGQQGLTIANGDGVAGNPIIGLDVNGMTNGGVTPTTQIPSFDGTNNVKITPTEIVSSRIVRGTFDNNSLNLGIIQIGHDLDATSVLVQIFDELNQMILPDSLTLTDVDTTTVDLSSYGTISGTWSYIIFG